MAKVHYRKAQKDYPDSGIAKGDRYYFCQIKTGPRSSRIMRQLQPFKQSQLTSSEFMSQVYELQERIEALTVDDVRDELQSIAEEIRALGDEQYDRLQNMPEGLQQGPTGELLEGRQNSCEDWASNLESVADQLLDEPDSEAEELVEPDREDAAYKDMDEAAFDEAWEEWNEKSDAANAYVSDMEDALTEAQGYMYEGE